MKYLVIVVLTLCLYYAIFGSSKKEETFSVQIEVVSSQPEQNDGDSNTKFYAPGELPVQRKPESLPPVTESLEDVRKVNPEPELEAWTTFSRVEPRQVVSVGYDEDETIRNEDAVLTQQCAVLCAAVDIPFEGMTIEKGTLDCFCKVSDAKFIRPSEALQTRDQYSEENIRLIESEKNKLNILLNSLNTKWDDTKVIQ